MACRECHMAKVKCDKVIPCSRCVRTGKECVKHESRQGRGRSNAGTKSNGSKRSANNSHSTNAAKSKGHASDTGSISSCTSGSATKAKKKRKKSGASSDSDEETAPSAANMAAAFRARVDRGLQPEHFGLRNMLRGMVAISLRRRHLGLLVRAGTVANQAGLTMDDLLCERHDQRGMDFLYPILLVPAPRQEVLGDRISWSEVPAQLLQAMGCVGATDEEDNSVVAHRWIWIRVVDRGISRYLTTPAFERDVCDWQLMQDTYQRNEKSVVELFLPPIGNSKHSRGTAHQFSLHPTCDPNRKLQPSRLKSKLRLKRPLQGHDSNIIDVEQTICFYLPNLDFNMHMIEYVYHPVSHLESKAAAKNKTIPNELEDTGMIWWDLDNLEDVGDLDRFLEMIS